jgi:hypothetical protein
MLIEINAQSAFGMVKHWPPVLLLLGNCLKSTVTVCDDLAAFAHAPCIIHSPASAAAHPNPIAHLVRQQQEQQRTLFMLIACLLPCYCLPVPAGAGSLRSYYLPDQGCLTSPLPASCTDKPAAAAAAWGSLPPTPNRPPPCPLSSSAAAAAQRQQQQPGSPFSSARAAAIAAAAAASLGGASSSSSSGSSVVTPGDSPHGSSGGFSAAAAAPGSPLVPRSPTILRPMMSMRLTCQPKWQFNEALLQLNNSSNGGSSSTKPAGTPVSAAAAAGSCSPDAVRTPADEQQDAARTQQQQQQQRRKAVNVHDGGSGEDDLVPSGLWPTLSFGLVPVRITPSRGNQQQQHQHQPAHATGRA